MGADVLVCDQGDAVELVHVEPFLDVVELVLSLHGTNRWVQTYLFATQAML